MQNATSPTPEAAPIHVTTERFEQEAVEAGMPVVIDFWAPWCGPCRMIGPALDELAATYGGRVKVIKVNVDDEPEIAQAFQVRGIPTVVGMDGRDVVDVQVGFSGVPALERLFETMARRT